MIVTVHTNAAQVSRTMLRLFRDQVPFANARAINRTAKEGQKRERAHMVDVFTIRRPAWVSRAIKIKPFARKRSPSATVQVEPPGGPQRADVLARHERAHQREPVGGQSLAVPIDVRTSTREIVKKRDRPKAYAFSHVRTGAGGAEVYEGRRRTFMVRYADGSGWILRRTGPGTWGSLFEGTTVLYRLVPEVPIEARLDFVDTMVRTVTTTYASYFRQEFARAVRTARRR